MGFMQQNQRQWEQSSINVKTAAWIRVGALGDLLVGLASLVETHKLFPHAELYVVGPKLWCEILSPEEFPFVKKVVVIERRGQQARLFENRSSKWEPRDTRVWPLHDVLRQCQAVVNTNIDSYRYGFAAWRARVPIRIGSAPGSMAWLYTNCAPFFGKDPMMHERDAALMLLEYADSGWGKFFRSTERNRINLVDWISSSVLIHRWRGIGLPPGKKKDFDRAHALTGCADGKYILLNPTASRREKAWPSENFYDLAKCLQLRLKPLGIEVLILGSPMETEWLLEVAKSEFKLVQPPTIFDLQDVLYSSYGLVTNTSSVQFIAAMTGTPTLTIMGRARPEIWGPLGKNDLVVLGHPPAELEEDIFIQELEGYKGIAVEEVERRALKLLRLEPADANK